MTTTGQAGLTAFLEELGATNTDAELLDLARRRILHGTPAVFPDEDAYYQFRKSIADKFSVQFDQVLVTGSAKLGFSPLKQTLFTLESDVDVAITSSELYERIFAMIYDFQMALRENRKAVSESEIGRYHKFLEYSAIGWMRPDLLPTSFRVSEMKEDWFKYFASISHGKGPVGDYKVNGGVFRDIRFLERYTVSSLKAARTRVAVGVIKCPSK